MSKQEIKNYDYEVQKILSDETATVEDTIQKLNNITEKYSKIADDELHRYVAKQTLGLVLELGGALLPFGGAAKAGGKITMKALKSKLGRKISQRIGEGIASGLVGGGAFGVGNGIANDKNPITEGIKAATFGATTGGMLTGTSANIEKAISAKLLKKYGDIDILPKTQRKQYSKDVRKFYQDYIQERVINKYGNVNFSKTALQEQLRWNPQQGQKYDELVKDLKKSRYLGKELNRKPNQKPDVLYYEVYQGKNNRHYIEVRKNGTRRYYIMKDTPETIVHATSTGDSRSANNILNHDTEKINLAKRLINKFSNKASITNSDDLERIFTAEEIGKMSADEFTDFEPFINKQINSGYGVPRNIQAQERVQTGDLIWVADYTRSDGTHVSGYFRHK